MKISLIKISFIVSLSGILALLFLLSILEPPQINVADITSQHLNKQVKIYGQVTSIKNFEQHNFLLLTIADSTGEIDVVISSINQNKTQLTLNQNITLIATVQQYKTGLQLNAEKIIS